jgi:hypothetical protein
MAAVVTKRQRLDEEHVLKVQRAVEMREEVTAAGRLPSEAVPQSFRIDREQEEVIAPGEVGCQGSRHLPSRREMDEAVTEIVGRAFETTLAPRSLQSGLVANLVDRFAHGMRPRD